VDAVRLLLNHGVDLHIVNDQGYLPVHEASSAACCRALLEHGAGAYSVTTWGRTPLHTACERGTGVEVIELLIAAGANVNAIDDAGETALHVSIVQDRIHCNRLEYVRRLLDGGADANLTNLSGDSSMRFAIMFNTHEILKQLLLSYTTLVECKNSFGHTFAHSIARAANLETLRILKHVDFLQ
jgi:ankyrin repeat protein